MLSFTIAIADIILEVVDHYLYLIYFISQSMIKITAKKAHIAYLFRY